MHEMSIAVEICRMATEYLGADVAARASSPEARRAPEAQPASSAQPSPEAQRASAASPARTPRLIGLGVEVGDDAGVEPESLQFCLEALLSAPPFTGARVALVRAPGDVLRLTYLEVDDGGADD